MLLILFFRCVTVKPSNTASHDNHEKINSWVSFCFPYEYGAPLGGPSGRRISVLISLLRLKNFCYAGQQRHRSAVRFPADVHEPAVSFSVMCTSCKTGCTSHIHFLGRCLRRNVIPIGFSIKFHAFSLSNGYVKNVDLLLIHALEIKFRLFAN